MAIPGHRDEALTRFEDGLYMELVHQHERLHLFVSSKADEISRRLGTSLPEASCPTPCLTRTQSPKLGTDKPP